MKPRLKTLAQKEGMTIPSLYFGMNGIHPKNPTVGIFLELSRKAPPGIEYPEFKTMGSQILKSVGFDAYQQAYHGAQTDGACARRFAGLP